MNAKAKILENRHRGLIMIGIEVELELLENRLMLTHHQSLDENERDESDIRYYTRQVEINSKKLEQINSRIGNVEDKMKDESF